MTTNTSLYQQSATPVTELEMLCETSKVRRRVGAQTLLSREFSLGVDSLVRNSLRHEPPWPIELEHAIELTEEAVVPLANHFADSAELLLRGSGGSLIARTLDAGGMVKKLLTLDEVETLFNRLVSVSAGRPTSQEPLPTDVRFFAAMLILREFMHHLRFSRVTLHTSRDQE
jgi:hypothetical protein